MMYPHHALEHAVIAHDGEHDRCGLPAILHPIQVVRNLKKVTIADFDSVFVEDVQVVGYLHDVLEDTDYSEDLLRERLTDAQFSALWAITRKQNVPYEDYIEEVCRSSIACYVKLADLFTNLTRTPGHNDTDERIKERVNKYHKAKETIWRVIGTEWWPV